jgi:hypothetical protein
VDHRDKVQRWKLAIQHFDFDIEHKGCDNTVADGLSRLCPYPEGVEITKLLVIQNLQDSWREQTATLGNMPLQEEGQVRPPSSNEIIQRYHNSTVGHFGVNKTYQKMVMDAELTPWTTMREDIETYIKQCAVCQKLSFEKQTNHITPFTLASYNPMQRIAVDTIGPINKTEDGYKYIIVIIDAFSRYTKLYPTKDTTAVGAADAIVDWVSNFGVPQEIVSENGTQFANRLIDQLKTQLQIKNVSINAYSHEENAIVERANKEVNRHLRAICFDRKIKAKWRQSLPLVQRIMNAQVHESIGVSPAQSVLY